MKNRTFHIIPLFFAVLFLFTACNDDDLCLRGSGQVAEYELDLSAFSKITLMGPVNLAITQGPVQSVNVVAEPELFGPMEYEVKNNRLEIGYINKNVTCFNTTEGVWIQVTVPDLEQVEVMGESEIVSEGELDLDNLEIEIFGRADVQLAGTLDVQRVVVEGSAEVHNLMLLSESVFLVVNGSTEAEFHCTDLLDLDIRGSASVGYLGQPVINQKVQGSLDLDNLN